MRQCKRCIALGTEVVALKDKLAARSSRAVRMEGLIRTIANQYAAALAVGKDPRFHIRPQTMRAALALCNTKDPRP